MIKGVRASSMRIESTSSITQYWNLLHHLADIRSHVVPQVVSSSELVA